MNGIRKPFVNLNMSHFFKNKDLKYKAGLLDKDKKQEKSRKK